MVERIDLEGERGTVVDVELGKVLEDLLQRRLRDAVLLDVHVFLEGLDPTEKEANGLVLTRRAKLVEISTLLQQLDLLEHAAQGFNKLEPVRLREAELHQGRHAYQALVQACFDKEVRSDTVFAELVDDQALQTAVLKLKFRVSQIHTRGELSGETQMRFEVF